jgi:hypothetical protein
MYSVEEARWKWSRLLHEQETLFIPGAWMVDLVGSCVGALLGLAAVRSQCLFMKMGMSEKARKRWVLICALNQVRRWIDKYAGASKKVRTLTI